MQSKIAKKNISIKSKLWRLVERLWYVYCCDKNINQLDLFIMRIFTISTLLFISILLSAQKNSSNFILNNKHVIWQKVYPTSLSYHNLSNVIIKSGVVKEYTFSDNYIIGEIREINIDLFDYLHNNLFSLTKNFPNGSVNAFVLIEFKGDKYRVTLKHINCTVNVSDSIKFYYVTHAIENEVLTRSRDKFKLWFDGSISEEMDSVLVEIFDFNAKTEDDSW